MTTMITEVYEAFKEANVSDAKAIAAATAIPTKDNLATKEDLLEVRSGLKEDLLEVRSGLKEDLLEVRSELKEEIAGVRQDIVKLEARLDRRIDSLETKVDHVKNDLIIKLGSLMVVGFGTLAVLMKIL